MERSGADGIAAENPRGSRVRRRVLVAVLSIPIILAAFLIAFVKVRGTFARYPFLQGSQLVTVQQFDLRTLAGRAFPRMATKPPMLRCLTYNIHRHIGDVGPAAQTQLKADGWILQAGSTYFDLTFKKASPGSSIGSLPRSFFTSVRLISGRAEVTAAPFDYSRTEIAEGWSSVVITEEYKPNWLGGTLDRLTGMTPMRPPDVHLKVVPGPEFARAMGYPSSTKP